MLNIKLKDFKREKQPRKKKKKNPKQIALLTLRRRPKVKNRTLWHSHSPSVVSWRCALRSRVQRCGLCAQFPRGCHFWPTPLLSNLVETDGTRISEQAGQTVYVFPRCSVQHKDICWSVKVPQFNFQTLHDLTSCFLTKDSLLFLCNLTQPFHGGAICLGQSLGYCHITKSYFLS